MTTSRLLRPLLAPLVGLAVAFPVSAVQSQGTADPLFKMNKQWRIQVEQLMDSARMLGLPDSILYLHALKGITRQADDKLIVRTTRDLYRDLKQAGASLGAVSRSELEAGMDALKAGVTAEELVQFRPSRGRKGTMAMTVLADFISHRGVPRDDAVMTITKLWRDGATDADFNGLFKEIDRDILSGVNPGAALQNRARQIPIRPPGRGGAEDPD
jgi:hypothetical protein